MGVGSHLSKCEYVRGRLPPTRFRFLSKGEQFRLRFLVLGLRNKRAQAATTVGNAGIAEAFHSLASRHAADSQASGDLLLGRNGLSRLEPSRVDLLQKILVNLVIKRDGTAAIEDHNRSSLLSSLDN